MACCRSAVRLASPAQAASTQEPTTSGQNCSVFFRMAVPTLNGRLKRVPHSYDGGAGSRRKENWSVRGCAGLPGQARKAHRGGAIGEPVKRRQRLLALTATE